jgi:sugar-specific transcriptional regulator TrmB
MIDCYDSLMAAGLTELEARTYVTLLRRKLITASEMARLVGISRTQAYAVVSGLIQKNLCTEVMGKVKKFSAIAPDQALQRLSESLENKKLKLLSARDELTALFASNSDNEHPLDFIKVLHTKTSIVDCVEQLEAQATHSVVSFTKPPYAMNIDQLNILNLAQKESMKRGIQYRTIYEVEPNRLVDFARMVASFQDAGEQVRIAYSLPMKFIIFDGQTVVFTLSTPVDGKGGLTAMTIQHSDLARTLMQTFQYQWDAAISYDDFVAREQL